MTIMEELRQCCKKLNQDRKEKVKSTLDKYFTAEFVERDKPFRAVIGNKKCKPIPIHRDFKELSKKHSLREYEWPNMSEEMLYEELRALGFVVTENEIRISVPPCEKGKKLTFAQEWVRKINYSYSRYCAKEKEKAVELYLNLISDLASAAREGRAKACGQYTLFEDFKFEPRVSSKCAHFMRRFMKRDGMEEYCEDGKYKGIKVMHEPNMK